MSGLEQGSKPKWYSQVKRIKDGKAQQHPVFEQLTNHLRENFGYDIVCFSYERQRSKLMTMNRIDIFTNDNKTYDLMKADGFNRSHRSIFKNPLSYSTLHAELGCIFKRMDYIKERDPYGYFHDEASFFFTDSEEIVKLQYGGKYKLYFKRNARFK